MKMPLCFLLIQLFGIQLFAQKKAIDISVFGKWPTVGWEVVSNDGKYVAYTVQRWPTENNNTLVLQATENDWKLELRDALNVSITQDSRMAVFMKSKDSMGIAYLGTNSVKYVYPVEAFKVPKKGKTGWLAYRYKTKGDSLVVCNFLNGRQMNFNNVKNYLFDENGTALLLQKEISNSDDSTTVYLSQWVDLSKGKIHPIAENLKIVGFDFDAQGSQAALIEEKTQEENVFYRIWNYQRDIGKITLIADDSTVGVATGLKIGKSAIGGFSKDGGRLYVELTDRGLPNPKKDVVKVDVWSYTDARLQSQQLNEMDPCSYAAVIDIATHRIIRLEYENEMIKRQYVSLFSNEENEDFVLVARIRGNRSERNWNHAAQSITYLVSTRNGNRKKIGGEETGGWSYTLSPQKKYAVFYDPVKRDYFSYEVSSGIIRNITEGVQTDWTIAFDDPQSRNANIPVAGWMKNDSKVLLYDQHDIWQVDPSGKVFPVNLTNGYGRKNGLRFKLGISDYLGKAFEDNEVLILNAYDERSKNCGFYRKRMNLKGDPEQLTMGPFVYYAPDIVFNRKARDAHAFVVLRESASESPNYFFTKDFRKFTQLSNICPEKFFNWVTTELHTWKTPNGDSCQGILYKPENFDVNKTYPIIFHYYDKKSNELNKYFMPEPTNGPINIPWFVSNGYLVFTLDIHYEIGKPGESVVNSVVSAADYLKRMPWVDSKRMGIQGHSFGGYETNYLVTHTSQFAAAMSSAGFCDLIGMYGSLWGDGPGFGEYLELRSGRMGTTPWETRDSYIKNSPIFFVDKVNTPLLLMHTKNDAAVPFSQGAEFFLALRRLGKRAWMLRYDQGNHVVYGKEAVDYTIRMTQFFDHYLKGAPAPIWMTKGIPARLRGIEDGLEFDPNIKTPGDGLFIGNDK